MSQRIFHYISLIFFLLNSTFLVAQNGIIEGKIVDGISKEEIVGANVIVEGTGLGASTDINGNYVIENVEPGKHIVVISFISYVTKKIQDVEVKPGAKTSINAVIEEAVTELADIVVTGVKETNTDFALLKSIKESRQIVSGISAEQISKSQDSDAADVVKRIPGVTVIGDRFIVIRGLSERYNAVMLHNAYAPSMEADIRSFAFDIIPSSQLDQMLIYKSPSPELPGDFAGGVVKVFTKSIPADNSLYFGYGVSFRQGTSMRSFLGPERGKLHWTGFNDGRYDLPESFPENIRTISDNPDALTEAGRSLQNNWVPEERNASLDQGFSITNNVRFSLGKVKVGNISALTYGNSKARFNVNRIDYNLNEVVPIYDFNDEQYNQNIRTGLLHNWAFQLNPNHTIELKNLFNQIASHQYINRTGTDVEFNYLPDNHSFRQNYRGVYSGQLLGKHKFFSEKTTIDWVAGYGASYRDMPDYRRYRSDINPENQARMLYLPRGAAQAFFLGRFYSEMREDNLTGSLNIRQNIIIPGLPEFSPVLSAGLFYETKDRSFHARNIGYVIGNQFNYDLQLGNVEQLFQPENINSTTGIRIDEQSNPSDSYSATNDQLSYYGSVQLPILKKIMLIGGIRMEDNTQTLSSSELTGEAIEVNNRVISMLPSANLSYNFTEKMLVRFAYGKTLNRPEFRELAPFGFYDFDYNLVKIGNPNLKNASIQNFDVRWEYYPTPNEILNIGVFYKVFHNAIETAFVPGGGSGGIKTFTFTNAEEATSLGVEVDMKKSLAGIFNSKFTDDISILFNAALIQSKVTIGNASSGRDSDNRPLQGQSPYIVNAGLYYNNINSGLQVNLLYNVIGPRIFIVGFDAYPDIFEMPRNILDLTISKNIGEKLVVKFGISDILNQNQILLQDDNQDGKYERNVDRPIQRFSPGTVYTAGFSFRLN
ncbi:MAG: TonB-dependent receptor [Bacteroidota bacterium]|nr:TonB-dependent receptor [Bacteroidota bacterium]